MLGFLFNFVKRVFQNVARSVVLCATVTPEANIQFLTVMATKMPFVGRG